MKASDCSPVFYNVNDITNFAIDLDGVLTDRTVLAIGTYVIQLTASDGTNVNSTVITITVQDTITPTWNEMPKDQTVYSDIGSEQHSRSYSCVE